MTPQKAYYKVSEVEALLNLPRGTLYHWEKQKVGPIPNRNRNGERKYSPKDLEKLRQVMVLKSDKNLKLAGVRQVMNDKSHLDDGIENTIETLQKLRSFFVALREELAQ